MKDKRKPACFYHPGKPGTVSCAECGKPLCASCGLPSDDGAFHCPDCAAVGSPEPTLDFSGDIRPAGFCLRATVGIAEFCALVWVIYVLFPSGGSAASRIAYQMFSVAGFFSYYLFPVVMFGATPLGKAAGLFVIDFRGEPVSYSSAVVRTGYLALSILAIVPLLGYIAAAWDKHKRGWHDKMAGTLVVTYNSGPKNRAGVAALAVILALFAVWYPNLVSTLTGALERAFPMTETTAAVFEPVWEKSLRPDSAAPAFDGERIVAIENGTAVAHEIESGMKTWEAEAAGAQGIYNYPGSPLFILDTEAEDGARRIIAISRFDGAIAWSVEAGYISELSLSFGSRGIYMAADGDAAMLTRSGKIKWRKAIGALSAPVEAQRRVLVNVEDGERYGTAMLDVRTGKEVAFFEGALAVAPVGRNDYLLSGDDGTLLVDVLRGKRKWAADVQAAARNREVYHDDVLNLASGAVFKKDGKTAYVYPDGCLFAGGFEQAAALSCGGRENLVVIHRKLGRALGRARIPAFTEVLPAGEDAASQYLVALRSSEGGMTGVSIVKLDKNYQIKGFFHLGQFAKPPLIRYMPDGRWFVVITDTGYGVYRVSEKRVQSKDN